MCHAQARLHTYAVLAGMPAWPYTPHSLEGRLQTPSYITYHTDQVADISGS